VINAQNIFNRTGAELSAEAQRVIDGTRTQAAASIERADSAVQRVMDRKGLTDRARQAAAARTFRQTQAQAQQLMTQHIEGVGQYRKKTLDGAFGARGGDAQTIANRRIAQQTVASVEDFDSAMELLRTAQQDGDSQLAQVIAGHAYSRGWTGVVDQWNHDGSNNAAVARLLELEQLPNSSDTVWRMKLAQEFHVNRPSVLDGLREQEIDALASDDLGDAA
jgi:hypothetical protein